MFSFARTNAKVPRDLKGGMDIVIGCLEIIWDCQCRIESDAQHRSPLKFWVLENPKAMLEWFLGTPVFEFDPCEFGDGYKKRTALWGYFIAPSKNPIQMPLDIIEKCRTNSVPLPKVEGLKTNQERRAITPSGFAQAFYEANQ